MKPHILYNLSHLIKDRMQPTEPRAKFETVSVVGDLVTIRDLDAPGCPSVTNDADAVVKNVIERVGTHTEDGKPFRIHYYDFMGNLDELMHEKGSFRGFKPVQLRGRRT